MPEEQAARAAGAEVGFFNFRLRQLAPPPAASASAASPVFGRRAKRTEAARFYHLRTGRGDWLCAGPKRVTMGADEADGRLIAVVPDANRHFVFLMAPTLRRLEVQADGMSAAAISGVRLSAGAEDAVRIRHPLAPNRFLGVTRNGEGAPEGCVVFDSFGRSALDAFQAVECGPAEVTEGVRLAALELADAAGVPFRAAPLLAMLRQSALRPGLAEPLLRLLPLDELQWLAARLLDDPAELLLLREAMPDNRFVARVIPELAAWARVRARPAPIQACAIADEAVAAGIEGQARPQLGPCLNALARRVVAPRHSACLIASARNEGPYLLEWLAYHRAIGFEHVFLYSNDNDDGSDALLEALADSGAITWIDNARGSLCGPQLKAYSHALSLAPHALDYRWAATLDLDEYFVFDTAMFASVPDLLAAWDTQPTDAVALCWLIYAAGAGERWGEGPVIERFVRREPAVNSHVKSVFRTNRFWHAQPHFPYSPLGMPFAFRTETGAIHHHSQEAGRLPAFAERPTAQHAWVNHYLLRSAPEALWKLARGRGDWPVATPERELEFRNFVCRSFVSLAGGALVEDRRIACCAPGLHREMAKLQAMPGVAEAEARIRRAIPARLRALVERYLPTDEAQSPAVAKFREMVLESMG